MGKTTKEQKVKFTDYQTELLYPIPETTAIRQIETCARICYRSKTDDILTAMGFLKKLWKLGHHSVFEHVNITVFFKMDRGLSHEMVRHRLCAFSQESTRYCNYNDEIEFVFPSGIVDSFDDMNAYKTAAIKCAEQYHHALARGNAPQNARALLPNMLVTRMYMTANVRQWMHIFDMRLRNPGAHPDMRRLMSITADEFLKHYPDLFGKILDLEIMNADYKTVLQGQQNAKAEKMLTGKPL